MISYYIPKSKAVNFPSQAKIKPNENQIKPKNHRSISKHNPQSLYETIMIKQHESDPTLWIVVVQKHVHT